MDEKLNIRTRLKHAWNAFKDQEEQRRNPNRNDPGIGYAHAMMTSGMSHASRPDRIRLRGGNERSIVTSVYNRIAIDVASVKMKHVRLDENGRMLDIIKSSLNECMTLDANLDQTGRLFFQDVVMSMLDEGVVAIVPTDTSMDPAVSTSYDILALRTGKITDWYPEHVRVEVYNEKRGIREAVVLPKSAVAIVENPFYAVMNEPNSTLRRLIRKLNILDAIDEQSGSGKLDMIIQLPYVVKTEARRKQAEDRKKDIEVQLTSSKYGIAYTDAAEKITQLNRPVENNLLAQIEYLTSMLYSQLGLTESVLDGTADEKTMLNYINRTVEPILAGIADEMQRKFLTKTARTQLQSIYYFVDPFRLVPVSEIADIADKFTRNEILSSNEVRGIVGYKPSNDPAADELRNKNLNQNAQDKVRGISPTNEELPPEPESETTSEMDELLKTIKERKGDSQNGI